MGECKVNLYQSQYINSLHHYDQPVYKRRVSILTCWTAWITHVFIKFCEPQHNSFDSNLKLLVTNKPNCTLVSRWDVDVMEFDFSYLLWNYISTV